MIALLRYALALIFLIATIIFGILRVERAGMDSNSEGRFFAERNMVVHDESGVLFFGLLALVTVLFTGLAIGNSLWTLKRQT